MRVPEGVHILYIFFIQIMLTITPIIADVGLWFVKSPEPFVAPLNDDVVFECSLNVPAEQIRWRHGKKYIQHNRTTTRTSPTTNSLIIKLQDESQLGDYQCIAWFGASALASMPAKLSLAEMKPFLHQADKRFQVTVGNTVNIMCPPPASNPSALLQYEHNNKKLPQQHVRILPMSNSLLLHNISLQDSGVYTCSGTNYITGQTYHSSHRVILDVITNQSTAPYAPRFLYTPQSNYIVQSGSNLTIECVAVGEPPPRVTWHKAGDSQTLPKNRTDLLIGGLHVRNIVPEDTGEYVCEMNNGVSPTLVHTVLLHVQEAPVIVKEPNRTLVEEEGDTELECIVSGNPIPHITWTLNGEPLSNDSHITSLGSKIILRMVQKRHAGIYQCFAVNAAGGTYGSAMLQVSPKQVKASNLIDHDDAEFSGGWNDESRGENHSHGHHGRKEHSKKNFKRKHKGSEIMVPPTRPNVTRLSDRSVMVRWHVPANNGLPILFFKVQYREVNNSEGGGSGGGGGVKSRGSGGGSRWMTSNEDIPPHIRSYEVDRLEPNRTYKFRVAAVYSNNDNKLGQNSYKFFLHQGLPSDVKHLSPPTLISSEALSPNSILIQWQYLNSVLTPVDGFYVYYRATSNAGDYVKATVEGEKTRSFVITHLQHDTSYDIKIQSFTVGAASDFSSIITRKTLIDLSFTTTESSVRTDVKNPSVILNNASSSTTHLFIVFGVILGALALIFVIFVAVCFLRQRNIENADPEEETVDKNTDAIMTIHQIDVVNMNGYARHSNKIANGNGLHRPHARNGFISPHHHINITNNPLAAEAKNEKNAMEMSCLPKPNNNCAAATDSCNKSDSDCVVVNDVDKECHKKWRVREQKTSGENYV